MGTWFWLNIPLALLFFCCWAGIPLWLTLTRWNAELSAKHAEITVDASPAPAYAQPAPTVTQEIGTRPTPELLTRQAAQSIRL